MSKVVGYDAKIRDCAEIINKGIFAFDIPSHLKLFDEDNTKCHCAYYTVMSYAAFPPIFYTYALLNFQSNPFTLFEINCMCSLLQPQKNKLIKVKSSQFMIRWNLRGVYHHATLI